MPLSLRLQSLLDRCEAGLPLWDLCCDHGHLGLEALRSGRFPTVIFNDAAAHVLDDLRGQVGGQPARLLCARAEEIREDLTGNVVIAGIGGEKIYKILRAAGERLKARHIVLCPEKDAEWLATQDIPGYRLIERLALPHGPNVRWIYQFVPVC